MNNTIFISKDGKIIILSLEEFDYFFTYGLLDISWLEFVNYADSQNGFVCKTRMQVDKQGYQQALEDARELFSNPNKNDPPEGSDDDYKGWQIELSMTREMRLNRDKIIQENKERIERARASMNKCQCCCACKCKCRQKQHGYSR